MTTAKPLLLDLLAVIADGERSATLFADDGVVELPFLHAIVIPPATRAAPEQITYFGPDGLMRRHDHTADVLEGAAGAHYIHDYQRVDGIMVPHRRRHPEVCSRACSSTSPITGLSPLFKVPTRSSGRIPAH
jgi:hypothetical protein